MRASTKWILLLLLLAAGVSAAAVIFRSGGETAPVARITRGGVLVKEIELDKVGAAYTFEMKDESGSNTVRVEPGRICISEADCPDQVCVGQGYISDGAVPIVCLPHKLMIEVTGGGDGLDAAAG